MKAVPANANGYDRLRQAERNGLKLALICRTVILLGAFAWYLGAYAFLIEAGPRWITILALAFYAGVGIQHYVMIGGPYDRWWIKYLIYSLDILTICALFAFMPVGRTDDVPQVIAFRAYGIYYLFPFLALACLSLSWGLVLVCGVVSVAGWWAAFGFAILDMERTLSWGDLPFDGGIDSYLETFLSPYFIGIGNRAEETALLFGAAAIMALAVFRARQVFLAQVRAEAERASVTATLGRYVPEEIVRPLIENPSALDPRVQPGTVLILDVAGFTAYAAGRDPAEVIERLSGFLAAASETVSHHQGVVVSFTGDGLLAVFNVPLAIDDPVKQAVGAAQALLHAAADHDFAIRVGLATGEVAAGRIGSARRQTFTVYGDVVNRAARLEQLAKTLGDQCLTDRETAEALSGQGFVARGAHELRGQGAIEVYALNGGPAS